jgi:hypothetical protein
LIASSLSNICVLLLFSQHLRCYLAFVVRPDELARTGVTHLYSCLAIRQ